MKKLLVGASLLLALGNVSANAADLPSRIPTKAPPIATFFDWTGFYIGAHAGYGWASAEYSDPVTTPGWSLNNKINGGLLGGQFGYNIQFGNIVLGAEGEVSWADIKGNTTDVGAFAGDLYNTKIKWLATGTGRIGFAADRALIYAKGGIAWADTEYNYQAVGFGPTQGSSTRVGWTVGAGVEYALAANWSAKVEYDYLDFGSRSVDLLPLSDGFRADIDQQVHTVKIGVNYRFGGPIVARY